jgi:4-amino-4-deoxy-L-arabinose transferase-like glycosyltransferase
VIPGSSPAPPLPSARPTTVDWCALAIVLLALAFRAWRLDVPFVDAHSWRQVTNADVARLWTEGPIDFFYPAVSWGGPDGRVGLEFPLLHLLMAWLWRLTGISDVGGRLVPAVFSVVTVWLTYRLGTRLLDRAAGRAAAFLMAVSPSLVYFGRTPLSDTPMLTFSVGAVLGYVGYAQSGSWRLALAGAVSLALAGLVKIPAILVLGPIGIVGLLYHGRHVWRDPWFTAAPLAALGAIGLWYLHADQIFLETGLTQAIFRPSGTYAPDIAQWAGTFHTVSHWTQADLLTWDTANSLLRQFWDLHLTPAFAVVTILGALRWHWPLRGRAVVDVWALAAASLIAVSLQGQIAHEFHQLPALPPLALYFGMGAAPLFDGRTYYRFAGPGRAAAIGAMAALLAWVAVRGFNESGVIRRLYRPDALNTGIMDAGRAIAARTAPDALIATGEYERYGSNSPMLLYFAHRKGWSFDQVSISPALIAYLRASRGVCFLAVGDWPGLERARPDVIDFLQPFPHIELPDTHGVYQLVDLGCGAVRRGVLAGSEHAMLVRR